MHNMLYLFLFITRYDEDPIMKTGAVIVAAGLSSRMGAFKPMLPFGDETIIRHNALSLLNAGCSPVCVVTGFQSDLLKEHLSDLPILCIENPDYRTTQMFDSVKIGLAAVTDSCDRILLTPGDACAYKSSTVNALLDSEADICIPVFNGKRGHPIMISGKVIPFIVSYMGEGGLGGALASLTSLSPDQAGTLSSSAAMRTADQSAALPASASGQRSLVTELPVNDPGILLDADTPEDYKKLTEYAEGL